MAISVQAPLVLSVHDRSWERRPGDFTAYERAWHALARPRALARRARSVLTPTATGKADLVIAWGLDPARVRAIPLAPAVTAPAPAGHRRGDHVLFVGALEPRKAPEVLAEAYALARSRGLAAELVVAGDGRLAGRVTGAGISLLGHVDDARLPALYAGALALAFPSLDEGFGLPPVEALGYGTPVIAVRPARPARDARAGRRALRPAGRRGRAGRGDARAGRGPGRARAPRRRGAERHRRPRMGADRRPHPRGARRGRGGGRRMSVSVVTVLRDSAGPLPALLRSLATHLPGAQVIAVDAASADDGPEVARRLGAEVVELGANPGFGAANNAGVARARSDVCGLLNPDCELLDDGLARLAAAARGHDALWAPRLEDAAGRPERSAHPLPGTAGALLPALIHPPLLPRALRETAEPWRRAHPRSVGWAVAACVVARTGTLRRLGPFDPAQFLFYEDMDLCLRARAAGIPTVFDPRVRVRHLGGHSTRAAYGGEPHRLLAARRRAVVRAHRGRAAAGLDTAAQALTFATRALARETLGRPARRERDQLAAALSAARRAAG